MLRLALAGLLLTTTALAQEPSAKPAGPRPGRITGIVVTDGGLPVAGATVTVSSLPDNSPITVVSSTDGTFEFPEVPSGSQRLVASKPGLLQQGAVTADGRRVTALRLRAGEHAKVTLTLARAGVVTGRIVDEFSEPVDGLEVHALRYGQGIDGRRSLMRAGDADLTDDRGEYRLFGLPPGDYIVMAVTTPKPEPNAIPRVLGPMGPFETLPTYFPGTHDITEARPVTLDAGHEMAASFTWRRARPFRISGAIVSERTLVSPMISLSTSNAMALPTSVGANGSFVIEGVGPGDYTLSVRAGREPVTTVPVSVVDADVTGLVVTMKTPVTIRGRVTFDGARPARTDLRFMSRDGGDLTSMLIGDYATVRPDGQFLVESSASHVTVEGPAGWSVTDVSVDGADAFASGIDLSGRTAVDNVHVRLTNKLTRVIGRVTSDRGDPVDNGLVLMLRLEAGRAPLRSVMRTLRTEADGRFETEGLRRGSYVAAAIDTFEFIADDEFLDRVRTVGRRFSLEDGQTVTFDLKPSEALRR